MYKQKSKDGKNYYKYMYNKVVALSPNKCTTEIEIFSTLKKVWFIQDYDLFRVLFRQVSLTL
jgi:hypothetical protein